MTKAAAESLLVELAKLTVEGNRGVDALFDALMRDRRVWGQAITVPAHEADYYEVPPEAMGRYGLVSEGFDRSSLVERGTPLMRAAHPGGEWARGPNDRVVLKNPNRRYSPRVTGDLSSAQAAADELFPGWLWCVSSSGSAMLSWRYDAPFEERGAQSPAIALVRAMVRAKIAGGFDG